MSDNEIDLKKVKGVTCDSRAVQDNYIFVAIRGDHHDGHEYIMDAIKNGALYIVQNPSLAQRLDDQIISSEDQLMAHPDCGGLYDYVRFIESRDPRRDLAILAAAFYQKQPETMIAVTGTNGKTSVADFVRQIMDHCDYKTASLGTLGVQSNVCQMEGAMTTPDPVTLHALLAELADKGVTHGVMEASSHGLDQYRLDGVQLSVAAFTNLTQDHLDYHETMDHYFDAKMRLFRNLLPNDGTAVVNIDDAYGRKINHRHLLTYGADEGVDLRLVAQTPTATGQKIKVAYKGRNYDVNLNLIGAFQSYNVLCAVGCCFAVGLDVDQVFNTLSALQGVHGRMQFVASTPNGASAFIDYAHTSDALENALKSLRPHVKGRLVCVFGAGGDRDKAKRPLMGQAVAQYADVGIVTDDNPRTENADDIRAQILPSCPNADNIAGRDKAIAHAVSILQPDDVLLVAGKGHEQGQTIGTVTHPFDDAVELRKAMEAL